MEPRALIAALSCPKASPNRPSQVSMGQTHISWLFFTERFVYKVKKPVDFGFLEFTTIAVPKFFCDEEVRLNRRLGAAFCVLECWFPEDEIRRRLQARAVCAGAVSDGSWEPIARQRQAFEPLFEVPPQLYLQVNTTQAPALTAEEVVRQLGPRGPLPLRSSCPAEKTDPSTYGAQLATMRHDAQQAP